MYYEKKKKDVLWTLGLNQVLKQFILTLDEQNQEHKQTGLVEKPQSSL